MTPDYWFLVLQIAGVISLAAFLAWLWTRD